MPDPMPNRSNWREALRGAEVDTIDLIFEVLTSQQWADLLRAPLERAAVKGERGLAQKLVGAGAEIGDALHEAIGGGHGVMVSDLLESGASLCAKDKNGDTPIHIAAYEGETEMVQQLLLKGADKDKFEEEEWTPLVLAANQDHLDTVLTLLAAGADVTLRCGEHGTTVVHDAAEMGHVEILRALIEYGADVDADGQSTALHAAAGKNKVEAIHVLVEAGANIQARSDCGRTPLHSASCALSREALLILLKHGAAVNVQNNRFETPLMSAAMYAGKPGAAGVVNALLRAGADETLVDDCGDTAADLIGEYVKEESRLAEDVERVRELLANAPADRVWRRRGYLVLCRAHAARMRQNLAIRSTRLAGTGPSAGSCAKPDRAGGCAGDNMVDESTGGDWTVVLAKVLGLQEEGIFRAIVGYL